ncbi:MAG: peptidylprolyl isomerase [Ignavibacteriae bacterium]|nr:peptidylprolyl isomerase [Ignavibacteriota bacterium]
MISIKFNRIFFIIPIAIFIFWNCSSNNENLVLAEFTGGNVLQNEYIDHYLLSTQYKPEKIPTQTNLEEIVSNKALEKISVLEALERNVDKDSIYLNIISNNERRLLYQNFIQNEISPKIISDSLINKFYAEFSPQYKMKYIMRPFLESSDEKFHLSQQKEINSAYEQLKNGKNFEEVVEIFSQDISTNKKGGDLGWIIRESVGDNAIRIVMDTLSQFNYSSPFKGYGGYYILYKGEKREVEVPAFDEVKQKIWQSLFHSRRVFIQNLINEQINVLEKKYNFKLFNSKIENILSLVENAKSETINFDKIIDNEQKTILAEYSNGKIYLSDIFAERKKSPTNRNEFFQRLSGIKEQHLISKYAKEQGLNEDQELQNQIGKIKTSLLSTILYQKAVKNKVNEELQKVTNLPDLEKVKYRSEKEKALRTEFENFLKEKYYFKFLTSNFETALNKASELKAKQNLEKQN